MSKIVKLLLIFLFIESNVFAYGLSPMNLSIDSSSKYGVGVFLLENKSDDTVPIELTIVKRTLDYDGKETLSEIKSNEYHFIVYPPMLTLQPHEKRNVKVVYQGPKNIEIEQTFRLFSSQLPLSNYQKEKDKNLLNILMRYGASLYVSPKDSEAKVVINEVKGYTSTDKNKNTSKNLMIILENQGNVHKNLIRYNLKLTADDGTSVTIPWELLSKEINPPVNIFAKQKRRVLIHCPQELMNNTGNIKAEIQYLE